MAINKNDYLDANGDYDLKKELVDELIDGVNGMADYVIETGSNSYGRWQKWASGRLVLNVVKNYGTLNFTNQQSQLFVPTSGINLPLSLPYTPVGATVNNTVISSNINSHAWLNLNVILDVDGTFKSRIWSTTSRSGVQDCFVTVMVDTTWK